MNVFHVDYSRLSLWSHTDLAYIKHDPMLDPFISYPPGSNSLKEIISNRKNFKVDRPLLLSVLKKQYDQLEMEFPYPDHLLLSEDTFTITTAHQPSLLTGPLYHIYKIASTINTTIHLNQSYPDQRFIPVFVIGGEDHDWAEINHFHLFGRKYQWDRTASGPCGRLSLDVLDSVIQSVVELFSNSLHGNEIKELLENCLQKANNYGQFHQLLIHGLFKKHSLLVLSMDDVELKKAFAPVMERELKEQFSFKYVTPTQQALEKAGFKTQAYCRQVNLFYMTGAQRERIELVDGGFVRVESGTKYSLDELLLELNQNPERFSPNVTMRPLYQEFILPNLAFVGGGGEIAYWMERKAQFTAAEIHFPMLIRRNSLLLIDESSATQLKKSDLTWEDMLMDIDAIVKRYLKSHSQTDLGFEDELKSIKSAYEELAAKADKLDPTLAKAILAEEVKQAKQFEQLGSRLLRAEKQQQDTHIKRIQKLKEKLFPENGLQERQENFLSFYAQYGPSWIDSMISICDPFEETFTVVELPA
ncbi:MAG TPA: bacillithiol biosynthesis cysteine-adding enzyme BshC [Saprospiraceae bacterium]|nr:bacillithiol biosynthesis cysteine-adding enzyme BshC [Saprospiraceae bacterium]